MYQLICGFGSFWLISGPVLDKLIAKSEVESVQTSEMVHRAKERINTQN